MKNKKIRTLTGTAMLTAVGVVLQYIEISIPIMPSFIKLDFSDLPELIGAFSYGPVAGIIICLLRNLIHLAVSQSLFIGELSNFILGAIFAGVAGLIYKKHKTRKTAFAAGTAGALSMAVFSIFSNYFVVYPIYYEAFAPEEIILQAYNTILAPTGWQLDNMIQALLVFNVPFTFLKAFACVLMALLIYKPLSKILKGSQSNKKTEQNKV